MDEKVLFFSTFLRHPKEIGSIIPSSKFLINEVLKNIDFENAKCIAEYGPGTGKITAEILKRSRKDAKILCFEVNKKFCNYLRKKIKDQRLVLINDSAENIKKYLKKLNIKKCFIIEEAKKSLKNSGKFVVYQFLYSFKKCIYNYFSKISIKFVPLNIPPLFVYCCGK